MFYRDRVHPLKLFPAPPAGTTRESSWPAGLAVLVAIAFFWTLPDRFTPLPAVLGVVLELILLLVLIAFAPHRHRAVERWKRALVMIVIGCITISNTASLWLLIQDLLVRSSPLRGSELIGSAVAIWGTNVIVFALWFWELDRGGPDARAAADDDPTKATFPDFQFPQMENPSLARQGWRPKFFDYLYVAFTNGTAFSPTDAMPLSHWAKLLMMAQSGVSLLVIVLVTARAVNVLS